jgi:hypothetical protein
VSTIRRTVSRFRLTLLRIFSHTPARCDQHPGIQIHRRMFICSGSGIANACRLLAIEAKKHNS